MHKQNSRTFSNLKMLEFVARKLGNLKDQFVFLGGCATALLIDDPVASDVRTTLDVDCIVDVLSLGQYYQLEKLLIKQGFKKSMDDNVICRWYYDDVILDVMPTDEKILGFGNPWYKAAVQYASTHQIAKNLLIKSVSSPYFLATKLEAFKKRGGKDYLMCHDFEDIISVVDGRVGLVNEVKLADKKLKTYLISTFKYFLTDANFVAALPGYLNYGKATTDRTKMVMRRIEEIASFQ